MSAQREFFSLKQIADAARAEGWPTGKTLQEARKLMRRRRVTRNRQTSRGGVSPSGKERP